MTIRSILTVPDPRLRQKCHRIEQVDDKVRALLDDMLETMYDAPGIGLAAIQIGEPVRAVVIDVSERSDEEESGGDADGGEKDARNPLFLVNPEIIWTSVETREFEEGCLSVPEYYESVSRPESCTVRYLDYEGKQQEMTCDDVLAVCVQHEIDHLDGHLFIDYISKLKRDRIIRKFTKARKALERERGAA